MGREWVWHKPGSAHNGIVQSIMPGNSASVTARSLEEWLLVRTSSRGF